MQPQIIQAGASSGSTTVTLYFEDGDGDIGYGLYNLYLKDSRDSSIVKMMIPTVPAEYAPEKGLKGFITFDYLAALLTMRPDTAHLHTDTLHWEIYMLDKAGNRSNTVNTDPLILFK